MDKFWDFLETLVMLLAAISPLILMGFIIYMCLK